MEVHEEGEDAAGRAAVDVVGYDLGRQVDHLRKLYCIQ